MCSNKWLEDDGFCTVCGQNHFTYRAKSTKRSHMPSSTTRTVKMDRGVESRSACSSMPQAIAKQLNDKFQLEVIVPEKYNTGKTGLYTISPVVKLINQLFADYVNEFNGRIAVTFRWQKKTYWTSFDRRCKGKAIIFGIKTLMYDLVYEFKDYDFAQYLLEGYDCKNGNALLIGVLHEFAHALTFHRYGPYQKHNDNWQKTYAEVLAKYAPRVQKPNFS